MIIANLFNSCSLFHFFIYSEVKCLIAIFWQIKFMNKRTRRVCLARRVFFEVKTTEISRKTINIVILAIGYVVLITYCFVPIYQNCWWSCFISKKVTVNGSVSARKKWIICSKINKNGRMISNDSRVRFFIQDKSRFLRFARSALDWASCQFLFLSSNPEIEEQSF